MTTQRDTFISYLFEKAKEDKDICLISVDMGAPSLDIWREELPDQFIAAGISEQNAINVAAGLSAAGKKVYVYFMAAWVARCFEQIRYSCAMGKNPITILGNGVALGYAPAGPAHEPTEDIAYMRSLNNIEIYSPANTNIIKDLVDLTIREPKLRYMRLERKYAVEVEDQYKLGYNNNVGVSCLKPGLIEPRKENVKRICILSSGYMLGRAVRAWDKLVKNGFEASVIDLWKIKPINQEFLVNRIREYDVVVTIEEQNLFGGFGSAVCEVLADQGAQKHVLRLGLPEKYIFDNGSRDHLLDTNGLSDENIFNNIVTFVEGL
jgi:transketolase